MVSCLDGIGCLPKLDGLEELQVDCLDHILVLAKKEKLKIDLSLSPYSCLPHNVMVFYSDVLLL